MGGGTPFLPIDDYIIAFIARYSNRACLVITSQTHPTAIGEGNDPCVSQEHTIPCEVASAVVSAASGDTLAYLTCETSKGLIVKHLFNID